MMSSRGRINLCPQTRFTYICAFGSCAHFVLVRAGFLIFVVLKMGTTLRSASALLCCLSLLILTSTASQGLPTRMQKSRIQESQGMLLLKRLRRGRTELQNAPVVLDVGAEYVAALSCLDLYILSTLSRVV